MSYVNNHQVPEGYLKNFLVSPDATQLQVYYKSLRTKHRPKNIGKISVSRRLYKVPFLEDRDSLEKSFSSFEDKVAPTLRRWVSEGPDPQDRPLIAEHIAVQWLRTEKTMLDYKMGFEVITELLSPCVAALPLEGSKVIMAALISKESIVDELLKRKWYFLSCSEPDRDGFVTSDNPVTAYTRCEGGMKLFGFSQPNCCITLPLSTKLCLVITNDTQLKDWDTIDASPEECWNVNTLTIHNSHRQVISQYLFSESQLRSFEETVRADASRIDPELLRKRLQPFIKEFVETKKWEDLILTLSQEDVV